MRRAVLRCAIALAERAEQQIRAAGRTPPSREYLMAALMPAAESAAASAKFLDRAVRQLEIADKWAVRAGETAVAAASRTAELWIQAAPLDIEQGGLTDAEQADFAGITAALEAPPQAAEPRLERSGDAE
jgi:hypothetical protein